MKHLLILVCCTLNVVLSSKLFQFYTRIRMFILFNRCLTDQLTINRQSQELYSYSTKSSIKTKIGYKMCLSSVPSYIYATVKATESSLPHTFNVTVLDVKESYFEVELKRTDISEGWNMFVTVDWNMYTGDFLVVNNKAIWIHDVFTVTKLNRERAAIDCNKREGQLVEIADKRSFKLVYNYVRNNFQFEKQEFVEFWLGSSYNILVNNFN
ncbi:uncharacterized protein LOC144744458 [Ciona intestinalis]